MQCAIPGNFAMIVKISLGLRKFRFRNHSENFAILAKLGNFARLAKFRYIEKITVLDPCRPSPRCSYI